MDETIIRLKLELSNVYSQRNSLSLTFRLPIEILEIIFIHCARDYHHEDRPLCSLTVPALPRWVNISYVCRRWRNVALNCPTLWSYLSVMPPRWTDELLARSRQVSLKLNMNLEYRALCVVGKVLNHVERIQDLYLNLSADDIHEAVSKLSSRTPGLQNLKVSTND
ncbi:hypothetical protein OG21DRAFT_1403077, partial [Imleria badia]